MDIAVSGVVCMLVCEPAIASGNPLFSAWVVLPRLVIAGQRVHEGARPPAVGLSVAAGCNVRRLGVARKRSGVMCGWLRSRVRTVAAPAPPPAGGPQPHPTPI